VAIGLETKEEEGLMGACACCVWERDSFYERGTFFVQSDEPRAQASFVLRYRGYARRRTIRSPRKIFRSLSSLATLGLVEITTGSRSECKVQSFRP
jgi:hypothetical protein